MGKSFPRSTSRPVHWIGTGAGSLVIPHICLGAYLIFVLLWDNINDFTGFIVWMVLTPLVAITVFGTLVMYFVVQANIRGSEQYARHGYCLAIAYLCIGVGVVGITWTYLIGIGYAIVSIIYFVESVMLLVFARRTIRELRVAEDWASMR